MESSLEIDLFSTPSMFCIIYTLIVRYYCVEYYRTTQSPPLFQSPSLSLESITAHDKVHVIFSNWAVSVKHPQTFGGALVLEIPCG
jgi:hypothetical protein